MPWYGLGLGSLWVFWPPHRSFADASAGYFAHNDYMQITLEAGYPGIVLLLSIFVFILLYFFSSLKKMNNKQSILCRVEMVSIFAALTTFSTHSLFSYNFYVLPLLIISGLYLGRLNQLILLNANTLKSFSSLRIYFNPTLYTICLLGIIFILCGYFFSLSLSGYHNDNAKELMLKNKYQASNVQFLKAQALAPLMDNAFFSHADLLRRAANNLASDNKHQQANSLLKLAHLNLNKAKTLNPLRPQTHHIRGLIYEKNQLKKAKHEYLKALKLNPRFLFSRIRLARLLRNENNLKQAINILQEGVDYNYPVNSVLLEYLRLFSKYAQESGAEDFAHKLKKSIIKYKKQTI